jgi:hypothetical protein
VQKRPINGYVGEVQVADFLADAKTARMVLGNWPLVINHWLQDGSSSKIDIGAIQAIFAG